jgi:uncharacterized membrane protein
MKLFQSSAAGGPELNTSPRSMVVYLVMDGLSLALAFVLPAVLFFVIYDLYLIPTSVYAAEGEYQRVNHYTAHVCHKDPARCFWMNGRMIPLCARCLGLRAGFLLGVLPAILIRRNKWGLFLGLILVGVLDIFLKPLGCDMPNAWRFLAGISLGIAATILWVKGIKYLWHKPGCG